MFRGGSLKEIIFNISATLRKDLEDKKTELEEYTSGTVIEDAKSTVDSYITGTSKPDIESYTTTKKGEIETLTTTKKSEVTSHTTTKTGEITSHTNTKIAEITSHTDTKISEVTSHTDTKKTELNTYEIQLEGSLDDYIIIKKSELDDYTLEKITEIGNATGVVLESAITDSYTGGSSSLVASQKALYDGLVTKLNNSGGTMDGNLILQDTSNTYSHELFFENDTKKMGIDFQNNGTLRFIDRENNSVNAKLDITTGEFYTGSYKHYHEGNTGIKINGVEVTIETV